MDTGSQFTYNIMLQANSKSHLTPGPFVNKYQGFLWHWPQSHIFQQWQTTWIIHHRLAWDPRKEPRVPVVGDAFNFRQVVLEGGNCVWWWNWSVQDTCEIKITWICRCLAGNHTIFSVDSVVHNKQCSGQRHGVNRQTCLQYCGFPNHCSPLCSKDASVSLAIYWNEDSVSEKVSSGYNVKELATLSCHVCTPSLVLTTLWLKVNCLVPSLPHCCAWQTTNHCHPSQWVVWLIFCQCLLPSRYDTGKYISKL